MITRRALLASLAAVAAAAAAPATAAAFATREEYLMAEHRWAVQGLLSAIEAEDFWPWMWGGEEQENPRRWRLARLLVTLRELDAPTALEQQLLTEVESVWAQLTRPADNRQWSINFNAKGEPRPGSPYF
jgi:hypothetical protein